MYSPPLVDLVSRPRPVDWLAVVSDALRSIEAGPLAPSLRSTLTTLNSYSAAPASIYANPVSGVKDAQVHVALLRALDKSVSTWPAALRRQVCAPTPAQTTYQLQQQQQQQSSRASSGHRGSELILEGVRPLSEAALVLYNAAAAHIEAGLADLHRVRVDSARLEPTAGTRKATSGASGATDGFLHDTTPLRAPSVNAKAAYKHFLTAQQLAAGALALLGPVDYGVALSPTETQYLRSLVDFQGVRDLAALCTATAKYVYSLFSSVVASKYDALARLAFAASTLPVPASITAPAVHLLPSLLLAAYHRHRAEHYYFQTDPQAPDMANALGHIRLAASILRELDRQCERHQHAEEGGDRAPPADTRAAAQRRQHATADSSAWGERLWSTLRALSASPRKRSRSPSGSDGQSSHGAENIEGEEPTQLCSDSSFCVHHLTRSAGDLLAHLFPVLDNLLRRTRELAKKFEEENSLVYFAKVTPTAAIQADVPDIEADDSREGEDPNSGGEAVLHATVLPPPPSVVDDGVFAALPRTADLAISVAVHQQMAQQQEDLLAAVERLSAIVAAMKELSLPREVELALEALQPCLEPHTGSVCNALLVARTAVREAWDRHLEAARHWAAARAKLLKHNHNSSNSRIAEEATVDPSPLTLSLEADVQCWTQAVAEATEQWNASIGPLDVASTQSATAIKHALVPDADASTEFIERCTRVVDRIVSVDGTSSAAERARRQKRPRGSDGGGAAEAGEKLATLEALEEEGEALLRRLTPLYEGVRWEIRQAAMKAVALAIWDAPQIVNRLDEGTARLVDETVEAATIAEVKAKLASSPATAKPRPKKAKTQPTKKMKREGLTRGGTERHGNEEEESEGESIVGSSAGFHTPVEASEADGEGEQEEEGSGAKPAKVPKKGQRVATTKRRAKKSAPRKVKAKKAGRRKKR